MDQSARTAALDHHSAGAIRCWSPPTSPPAASMSGRHPRRQFRPARSQPDDYVHRIGRTGRAGRAGTAISIVTLLDQKSIVAIEAHRTSIPPSKAAAPFSRSRTPPRCRREFELRHSRGRDGAEKVRREGSREGSRGSRNWRREPRPAAFRWRPQFGPAAGRRGGVHAAVGSSPPRRTPSIGTVPSAPGDDVTRHRLLIMSNTLGQETKKKKEDCVNFCHFWSLPGLAVAWYRWDGDCG